MEETRKQEKPKYHNLEVEAVIDKLNTDIDVGLSKKEASIRITHYGSNIVGEKQNKKVFEKMLKQLKSPLVIILLVATLISFFIGHNVDAFVILAVVLLNGAIGFSHEFKVERAMAALRKTVQMKVKTVRDGVLDFTLSKDLVPGDIIMLEAGDNIPADCRIISSNNLKINEASLTGESNPVEKDFETISESTNTADQSNMLFMGTIVTQGQSSAVVVFTGSQTVYGSIAKSIETVVKESAFNKKIKRITKQAGFAGFGIAALLFTLGLFVLNYDFTSIFIFSIAALVSIIPEGLPAILSIILAVGAKKMAKNKAIVKNLSAIESIGVSDIIITDKTGTLTTNTMNVQNIMLFDGSEFNITGNGWESSGKFKKGRSVIDPQKDDVLKLLLEFSVLCNDSHINRKSSKEVIIGEPTEAALLVMAEKAGITRKTLKEENIIRYAPPFNSEDKYRSILLEKNGASYIVAIGAPESILSRSTKLHDKKDIGDTVNSKIKESINDFAENGLRTLSVGYKVFDTEKEDFTNEDVSDLSYLGIVGMKDPVREQVPGAILQAQNAGIRVIMATGDHVKTAKSIAMEIGIAKKEDSSFSQADVDKMTDQEFIEVVKTNNVFARVSPQTKQRIAKILQADGHVVTMTGDGVNDAPALRQADVGVSMGKIGTDAARAASSIILTDDNFATIVNAVRQGRIVFNNISNTTAFLFSTNLAEAGLLLVALALGLPLPLLATQILWLNLITDSVGAIPLAFEGEHGDELSKQDLSHKEIIPKKSWVFVTFMAIVMIILSVSIYAHLVPESLEKARTAAFTVVALTQILNIMNVRSLKKSIFSLPFAKNRYLVGGIILSVVLQIIVLYSPALQNIFGLLPPTFGELMTYVGLSLLVVVCSELYKTFITRSV